MGILKKIFTPTGQQQPNNNLQQNVVNPGTTRNAGETFQQYGIRTCGIVSGSVFALPGYLHTVYNTLRTEQENNEQMQTQKRKNIQAEIDQQILQKKALFEDKNKLDRRSKENIDSINEKQKEIYALRSSEEKKNKDELLKRNIGLVIIIPLTIYLFIFYSSTFYSAFFRDPSSITDVMNAMFDANALSNAFNAGVTELLFCLLAPIIFLGLGFILHIFTKEQGKYKYFKVPAIVIVTLMFDMILAYKIGDQLHQLSVIIGTAPRNEVYTIAMALHDVNSWAVIFLGFISYIIWGLVFDMTMEAHQNIDFNKTEKKRFQDEINQLKEENQKIESNIKTVDAQIKTIEKEIIELENKLANKVFINVGAIKEELNNFRTGWWAQLKLLGKNKNDFAEAQSIYDQHLNHFFSDDNKN